MGCVELSKENKEKAKELFLAASEIDQSSVEAFYNLGMLHNFLDLTWTKVLNFRVAL